MKKLKSKDGYNQYSIEKEGEQFLLANQENYKKNIEDILNNIEDLKFDSVIIIFGLDTGEYLKEVRKVICERNKILIIEPNEEIYSENKNIGDEQIGIVKFNKETIERILYSIINFGNFNNLYVSTFGYYEDIYKEEWNMFKEYLDNTYYSALCTLNIANRFREDFLRNLVWNSKEISKSISINNYLNINEDIPAFIISAGPSLEENIKDLVKYKELVEKSIIITGTRSLNALVNSGIKTDYVVTIDPVDLNYEMIKDNLNSQVPLMYYEYSNHKIINEYKGEKIYLSNLFSLVLDEYESLKGAYLGGSVAHTCVDIAVQMGCNPIIFIGQDFAYTDNKIHADSAVFNFDKEPLKEEKLTVKNVFGVEVYTSTTLNFFRKKMEEYIKLDSLIKGRRYINSSKGADIEGSPFMQLSEVFKMNIFNKEKTLKVNLLETNLDGDNIVKILMDFINFSLKESSEGKAFCEELIKCDESLLLIELDIYDKRLRNFLEVLEIIDHFESCRERLLLGGYFNKFLFEIKEREFKMLAKDFNDLSSNLKYQSEKFLIYFKAMESMLTEAMEFIYECVTNTEKDNNI